MNLDWTLVAACFGIGIVVGLTGMGGGALMTPVLVLFFNIPPLTAVSSDLVAAAVMKPVGAAVHMRHGTVNFRLAAWLCVGSVPAAFSGVFVIRALGDGDQVQQLTRIALGVALLIAAGGLTLKAYVRLVERARNRRAGPRRVADRPEVRVRILPTVLIGAVGGLVVGMTSVGSGSLIIIALMALYPMLRANSLVGTDLTQAVPLVMSAAIAHVLYGDFELALTTSLLIGSIPGVWIGAQLSSRAPGGLVRRALAFVLLASALKLLEVPTATTGVILCVLLVAAPLLWMAVRRYHGLPAVGRRPNRVADAVPSASSQVGPLVAPPGATDG
jgi:uncharacterized protein